MADEITPRMISRFPRMFFTNVTGGEPFVRQDLPKIISELKKKSGRIVISTNGFFTDRIIALCKKNPDLGIRISIEGNWDNKVEAKTSVEKALNELIREL